MPHYLLPNVLPVHAENLFVAATAYHVILAHLLAADKAICPGECILLMKQQRQKHFEALFDSIRADSNIPFRDVFFLAHPKIYKRRHRQRKDRQRLPALRRLVDAARPHQLFLFNETNLDQDLARRVRSRGGNIYAVEDGAAAYSETRLPTTHIAWLKNKLFFGPQAKPIQVEGSSHFIDAFFAAYPQLVRKELRQKQVRPLPRAQTHLLDELRWPAAYLGRLGITPADVACDIIYLLAHSSNFNHLPEYRSRLRATILQNRQTELRNAISYHPREKLHDPLNVTSHGVALIPSAVPAELIFMFNRGRLREVYGDIGTSLMTARWLLPDARAVSLVKHLNLHSPAIEHTLSAIGVEMR